MSTLPLVPATSPHSLSPAVLRTRLAPYSVQSVMDMTLYLFRRGKGAEAEPSRRTGVKCDEALLIFWSGKPIFRLQYYPKGEVAQVTRELPMEQLYAAVADLVAAGFPCVREIVTPKPTVEPPARPAQKSLPAPIP